MGDEKQFDNAALDLEQRIGNGNMIGWRSVLDSARHNIDPDNAVQVARYNTIVDELVNGGHLAAEFVDQWRVIFSSGTGNEV